MLLRCILLLFVLTTPFLSNGQKAKLKEGSKLDTVYAILEFSDHIEPEMQKRLAVQFDSLISAFNRTENSYVITTDSTRSRETIRFAMGPIKYVDWKRNAWVTGLDIAMIGANILIMPYFPPVIPFYLMPAAVSKVNVNASAGMFAKPYKIFVNPNGYLASKDTQTRRFYKRFDRVFYSFFVDLSKQNSKIKKQ